MNLLQSDKLIWSIKSFVVRSIFDRWTGAGRYATTVQRKVRL